MMELIPIASSSAAVLLLKAFTDRSLGIEVKPKCLAWLISKVVKPAPVSIRKYVFFPLISPSTIHKLHVLSISTDPVLLTGRQLTNSSSGTRRGFESITARFAIDLRGPGDLEDLTGLWCQDKLRMNSGE